MLEQQLLEEFATRLKAEVADKLAELAGTILAPETALAEVMLGYMEEAGLVTEHELCPFEDTAGRNRCRIVGYALPEDSSRLELFTAQFLPSDDDTHINADDLSRLFDVDQLPNDAARSNCLSTAGHRKDRKMARNDMLG